MYRIGVVCSVMKLGHCSRWVFKILIFTAHFLNVLGILYSYGFGQISEAFGIVQIQFRTGVIDNDPGENGVLGQVVESAASDRIQLHQIFKIGDLTLSPLLSETGGAQQIGRGPATGVNQIGRSKAQDSGVDFVAFPVSGEVEKHVSLVHQKHF